VRFLNPTANSYVNLNKPHLNSLLLGFIAQTADLA
jgi:hypothetical protein